MGMADLGAMTVDELLAFNAEMLERHQRLRVYRLFSDGTLDDPDKRAVFLACAQVIARHFQTMLFARQAHCDDERYRRLFLKHLREESGHDELLAKDRGRSDEVWDPILEAGAAWFISRMTIVDNIEKLAIVHLVLESSGAYMGSVSKAAMRKIGAPSYFELHDEVDRSHIEMAIEPLRQQSPETIARVRVVIDQAWQMMNLWIDRIATVVFEKTGA